MMKIILILVFLGLLVVNGSAQEKQDRFKPVFRSSFAAALINGSASTSFNIQTVQGVSFNKSFVGAGVGIDYYTYRSIPLFLQLRQEFGKGKNHFFVYTDGGHNFDWLTDKSKETVWAGEVDYKGGWYYDVGVGYKINLKENAMMLSTGYSYKEIHKNIKYLNCMLGGACEEQSDRYLYRMSRISVRASFQF